MRVLRHTDGVPADARGAVVAIGNFDGLHRGHQAVIGKAARLARELEAPLALLTFEPHPRSFFRPQDPPFRLTPFRLKARLIEALGVDLLVTLRFDRSLASLSAEDFVRRILVEGLAARHIVVGDNFHFGKGRGGDVALLEEMGRHNGFGVSALARVVGAGSEPYSSTQVREYLKAGNPTRAGLLLGHYWEIAGRVQHGDKRGRELGFPTANLRLGKVLRPAFGIYAVRAGIDRGASTDWYGGAANVGMRPMWRTEEPMVEVHLFDFEGDLYGKHLRVALVDYLRPELKFDSLEALTEQIAEDCRRARDNLAYEQWDSSWPASPFMTPETERKG
jgi:riboflavin kinase/FMN adenylyltransferase